MKTLSVIDVSIESKYGYHVARLKYSEGLLAATLLLAVCFYVWRGIVDTYI